MKAVLFLNTASSFEQVHKTAQGLFSLLILQLRDLNMLEEAGSSFLSLSPSLQSYGKADGGLRDAIFSLYASYLEQPDNS